MNWIFFSVAAYFLLAVSFVIDKVLLKQRIPHPAVYAFYVALLSLLALLLAPWGMHWLGGGLLAISFLGGIFFVYALLFFYQAVKENEISRVAPLIGSITPVATLLVGLLFDQRFSTFTFTGIGLLVAGGFFISFDLPIRSLKIFRGFLSSITSGIFFALAYLAFEYVYRIEGFLNGFIWTRLGLFVGALSLLFVPVFRKNIINSFKGAKKKKRKNISTVFVFVLNKIFGGGSSVLINFAISISSASVVNALGSVQFVFVLGLAALASLKYSHIFEEKLYFWDWAQKIAAIGIIAIGMFLVSF
ncbi:MAG: EamA-like protein transporter family protein [Candidatus Moranbacteria bacterium GW2011_GWE2_35_2-]|nr:MAG: EamA-like protein transporter family protein [Candidatus Moranbacteria bacterium GW2011_GWE2_35_2-]KKQ06764.1 MAG: EamA-like protein transporter family protein [Candidatus Moranbacteria bacterium GW2011_GWF1_36_4]KKQ22488.1 MAG: EamA-like protein transporter family protein [Candidatus Moranbacteria bacterium GW2011_GWF2_37_11]KKQ29557.1 MAG: EamA-like protein transporter family protein [Candidatus Moranbacteria bacterium GW2011_GWD1_37_17]KKQ30573.1 MAG: EamA-like protein transporter fa